MRLSISGPLAGPNSLFINGANSAFQVFDDNNQQLQQMGSSQNVDGTGQVTLILYFMPNAGWRPPNSPPVGPPRRLQCEVTTETRPMTEHFELDDLPLLHAPDEGN